MAEPAGNGSVIRLNLGRVGALIGLVMFVIQMLTIFVSRARSDSAIRAEVSINTAATGRLVDANLELVKTINVMLLNQALDRQRIEVLEKANPPGIRP